MGRRKSDATNLKCDRIAIRILEHLKNALQKSADANGLSFTDEIEGRLIETLIRDGLMTANEAREHCSGWGPVGAAVTESEISASH